MPRAKITLHHHELQGEFNVTHNLFYKARAVIRVSCIETSFIQVFSRRCGVPCRGRMWVTFHLDITIRVWEILPLIREKCQSFDSLCAFLLLLFWQNSLSSQTSAWGLFCSFLLSGSVVLSPQGAYMLLCRAVHFQLHMWRIMGDSGEFSG